VIGVGIEGTAHTFGVGIVDDKGTILSNVKSVYNPEVGGIHPREAARHHINVARAVLKKALDEAKVSLNEISFIAFSQGPGLAISSVCA